LTNKYLGILVSTRTIQSSPLSTDTDFIRNRHRDSPLSAKRIVFGFYSGLFNNDGTAAVTSANDKGLACNQLPVTPNLTAEARAGSQISFRWTQWLPSHHGPMTTWMAPYSDNISTVDVNALKFFKIHEGGLYRDQQFGEVDAKVPWAVKPNWETDKMIAANGLYNATVPWDIKPGNYVVRHELLALHFATTHSNYWGFGMVGPQFYPSCYSVRVIGNGTATPAGVTFPGAYQPTDPGLVFDIFNNKTEYPIPGPKVYTPAGMPPVLKANAPKVISPTGDPVQDEQYLKAMENELSWWGAMTDMIYKLGG
jgi:hypothetical protein